jgi:short-subunit dehydrogenase
VPGPRIIDAFNTFTGLTAPHSSFSRFLVTNMQSFEIPNLFSCAGKVVLVTGGSRGIGKMVRMCISSAAFDCSCTLQIATGFVKNGAKVYITSRSAKDCDATAKELNAAVKGSCIALPADLQKVSEVDRLVKELSSREKHLHVLINNAGATWGAPLDEYPDDAWTKVMTLNVQRVFTLTQKCLPLLRAAAEAGGKERGAYKDPSRIINVSTSFFPITDWRLTCTVDRLRRGPFRS